MNSRVRPPPYPCNLPLSVSSSPSRINTNTFGPASAPSVFHCFNAFYFSLLTTLLSHHSHYLSRCIFKSLQAEHVCLTQVTVTWTEGYYNNYNTKSNQSNKVILISLLLFFQSHGHPSRETVTVILAEYLLMNIYLVCILQVGVLKLTNCLYLCVKGLFTQMTTKKLQQNKNTFTQFCFFLPMFQRALLLMIILIIA